MRGTDGVAVLAFFAVLALTIVVCGVFGEVQALASNDETHCLAIGILLGVGIGLILGTLAFLVAKARP